MHVTVTFQFRRDIPPMRYDELVGSKLHTVTGLEQVEARGKVQGFRCTVRMPMGRHAVLPALSGAYRRVVDIVGGEDVISLIALTAVPD